MTEEEFRSGKLANGERLMQPENKAEAFHQIGLSKLHNHFKAMQAKAAEFVSPEPYVCETTGYLVSEKDLRTRNTAFARDIVHMLDGPEQRAIEAELNNLKPFDYVAEANLTLSPQWHGDKVAKSYFVNAMLDSIQALQRLDKVKKTLFYGKDNSIEPVEGRKSIADLPERVLNAIPPYPRSVAKSADAINLIHAIVGIATEAGEMLEALRDAINGDEFDLVNLEEEIGDCKWYMAIASKVAGFQWGDDERKNIAKLRARFPDRFTEYDANNRDLVVERAILEDRPLEKLAKSAERHMTEKVDIAMQQRRGPIGDCEGMDC